MADPLFMRVAYRYRQYDRYWWEVHATSDTSLDTIKGKFGPVISASLACRHPAVTCVKVRIANPFAPRQGDIDRPIVPGSAVGTNVPDPTSVAGIYSLRTVLAGVKRSLFLRGLPRASVTRLPSTGADVPGGDLPNDIKTYFAALRAANYGVASLVPQDNAENKRWTISSATVLPLQQVKLNFMGAPTFNALKRVVLYQIPQKLFPGLSGRFTVVNDATSFIPQGYLTPMAEGDYPFVGAAFRMENWRFSAYGTQDPVFLAFDRRDTKGGPLDSRGRSRSRIRRSR